MKFHASSLGLIMTDAQSIDRSLVPAELLPVLNKARKNDEDKALLLPYKEASLSAGAKTYLNRLAKEQVYGYRLQVETKYMDKGIACEPAAIQLLNDLRFKNYTKNTERRESEFLTGECDIYVPGVKTIDTKVAWSLDTFPAVSEDAHDSLYEWQGHAYMKLWDVPEHEVCYLMLDTPEEMIRWEQVSLHRVGHIEPELRCTSIIYKRDLELEAKMDAKCAVAMAYLLRRIDQIHAERVPKKIITMGATMPEPKEESAIDTRIPITVELEPVEDIQPLVKESTPTLRLGQISERLGFTVTADFMLSLGFAPAATMKASKLYHEADFPKLCQALRNHIATIQEVHTPRI